MNSNNVSISMVVDNKLKKSSSKIVKNNSIYERRIHTWVKDETVLNCYNCNIEFNFYIRKHHCRKCGKIYCANCSNFWIQIPEFLNSPPKQNNIWSISTYLDYFNLNDSKERVCQKCFMKIYELKELFKTMEIMDKLSLDISDYKVMSQVCKSWNKIANYYFSYFREIQYY